jgi:hypothetical protein
MNPEATMSDSDLTQTPYGLVPRSEVIEVGSGEGVKLEGARLKRFDVRTGKELEDLGQVSESTLSADPYAHAATLRGETQHQEGADKAANSHYAAAPANSVQSLRTTWKVPSTPTGTSADHVFFLWNGLQGGALQPVLDWRNGAGPQYGIANWAYVGKYVHGPHITGISPQTPVTGAIDLVTYGSNSYTYQVSFAGYKEADLTVVRAEAQPPCLCFEPYGGARPPDQEVRFYDIVLRCRPGTNPPESLNWSGMKVADDSSSHGEVDCEI